MSQSAPATLWDKFSTRVTSRRGAWLTVVIALLAAAALMGALRTDAEPGRGAEIPPSAESAVAAAQRAELPGADTAPLLTVFSRDDAQPLTEKDNAAIAAAGQRVADALNRTPVPGASATEKPTAAAEGSGPPRVMPSEDGRAAIVMIPLTMAGPDTDEAVADEYATTQVDAARAAATQDLPAGLQAQVTGGPAFGVDVAGAFSGANWLLLAVTIGIVAVLLLLTYRSPLLMLIPLAVVGLVDQIAAGVTAFFGVNFGFGFDAGIVSVLVFGAGTNYALLMISRYREELTRTVAANASTKHTLPRGWHRAPLARAAAATWPAILASNVTVVLALITLLAAAVPSTRGIGIASAIGLALTIIFVAPLLPAVLAITGPGVFWPRNPARRPAEAAKRLQHRGVWGTIGHTVAQQPKRVLAAGLVVLVLCMTGLLGTGFGLSQTDRFRVQSESAAGLETIAAHYPAGSATPLTVVTSAQDAQAVRAAVSSVAGVSLVDGRPADSAALATAPGSETGSNGAPASQRVAISVTGEAAPATAEAFDQVRNVREAARSVDPTAVVGGQDAEALDARSAAVRDLGVALPLILAVVAIVVGVLMRSWVLALVIMLVDVVSALAAMGLGTAIGRFVFGFPALDTNVPLLAVLFLVALGVDYSLFLAHRVKQELAATDSAASGHERVVTAVTRGLSATGGVITSAGIVLAAVFAALGVLPLVTLLQLGVIVCVGVLIDTLLVRTVVMPAIFAMLPIRAWGPLPATRGDETEPGTAGSASLADPELVRTT